MYFTAEVTNALQNNINYYYMLKFIKYEAHYVSQKKPHHILLVNFLQTGGFVYTHIIFSRFKAKNSLYGMHSKLFLWRNLTKKHKEKNNWVSVSAVVE